MIETIYVLGLAAAILVNIAALTLLVVRYIPFPATARAAGLIAICLALFSFEHFVGFGRLYPLFLPLTALSLFVIWCERAWFSDETFRTSEIVFLCALLYGAVWRLSFPEIVEDNDRLTDFHFVANYLAGTKLPPVDYWLPYQRLDYYYTFQHYSAALLGRIFGLGPGASFTLASIILPALVLGLAWEFLTLLRVRLGGKLLSLVALAIGGTGLSPLLHVIKTAPSADFMSYTSGVDALIFNSRFLGYFDSSLASAAWHGVFGDVPHSVRLPIETFGYQYAIGGYNAVLSGFLLQFLALTIMAAIPCSSQAVRARLDFVLGSRCRSRSLATPGCFHSRRRWSVPGRCGTGATLANGICSRSAPVPWPACFCFCRFSQASARQAGTCRWRSSPPTRTRRSCSF
jgi:uncharacterized protein DUF2298